MAGVSKTTMTKFGASAIVAMDKDYNKIKDKETVERMIKGGKVEIKKGGSTSLQMPGFIHDPKISEYSSLVKNFNK